MAKMIDLISIIVPVYNVKSFLSRCLDSILNQTYKYIEVLLVDDESFDGSGDICDEYANRDCRIKVIHKKNAGVNEARITGLKHCSGAYITFIDSDDFVSLDYVEHLYHCIKEYKVEMACCQRVYIYEKGKRLDVRTKKGYFDRQGIEQILLQDFLFDYRDKKPAFNLGLCCKMIKKQWLEGAMEEARGLWIGEDLITLLYVTYRIPSLYISSEYLYYYIQHSSQSTRRIDITAWENQVLQWNRILDMDDKSYLSHQLACRILFLLQLFIKNIIQNRTVYSEFVLMLSKALEYPVVKQYVLFYKFDILTVVDRVFIYMIRHHRYKIIYYVSAFGVKLLEIKNVLKNRK
ncbi:MAG: glycosyltransferase family 2 protein [Bacteroidaceae bacterium]|nr:glycosyltransferase family 2 protein [Bacteroidaceae bacterium]